jgi:hypothetical protein
VGASVTEKKAKVVVSGGFALSSLGMHAPEPLLVVKFENHSPKPIHIVNFVLELKSGETLLSLDDLVTGRSQGREQVEPGNLAEFHFTQSQLFLADQHLDAYKCATVQPSIGDPFRSSTKELRYYLEPILNPRE